MTWNCHVSSRKASNFTLQRLYSFFPTHEFFAEYYEIGKNGEAFYALFCFFWCIFLSVLSGTD